MAGMKIQYDRAEPTKVQREKKKIYLKGLLSTYR